MARLLAGDPVRLLSTGHLATFGAYDEEPQWAHVRVYAGGKPTRERVPVSDLEPLPPHRAGGNLPPEPIRREP